MSYRPDSISSGASYYNNSYRQDPGFRQADRVLVDQRRRLDSIQSEQQRLEKDIQSQLQTGRLPAGSIVLAIEVGRFIILAVLLPPYYIVYEGPKWLFLFAKPFILKGLVKGEEFFKYIQSFIVFNLKNLFQFTVEKPFNLFQKLFKKLATPKLIERINITDFPAAILKVAAKPFQVFAEQLRKFIPFIQTKFQGLKNVLPGVYLKLKNFTKETLQQLQTRVQASIEKVVTIIKPYAQKINAVINKGAIILLKRAQATINHVLAPVKTVAQFIQRLVVQNFAMPLQAFIKLTIQQKIAAPIKRAIAAVLEPLKTIAKQVTARLETIKESLDVPLKTVLKVVTMPVALLANVYAKAIPTLHANLRLFAVPFRHFVSSVKRIGSTLKRAVERVTEKAKDYLNEKMKEFKDWSRKGKQAVLKKAEVVIKKIKQVPVSLLQKLKRLLIWIRELLVKFSKSLKTVFIWVKILIRYSFQQPTVFRKEKR